MGVVGTGASAVQVVSGLAPLASHLTVFQRTASWVFPKFDFKFPGKHEYLNHSSHRLRVVVLREGSGWLGGSLGAVAAQVAP